MSVTKTTSWNYRRSTSCTTYALNAPNFPVQHHTDANNTVACSGSVTYGGNIKDWRQRIARGQSATTTLDGTSTLNYQLNAGVVRVMAKNNYGQIGTRNLSTGHLQQVVLGPPVAASGVLDSIADQRAASKYLSKYLALTNTWRGGNFLAEIRETWHMLRHPVQSMYQHTWDFAGKVKKLGNTYRTRKEYGKHLADAWLAYQFGIKPLISDANDAQSALEKLKNGTEHDQKVISAFGRNQLYSKTLLQWQPFTIDMNWSNGWCYKYIHENHTVRYLVAVKAIPEDRSTVADQFGVGVFDVIPAVWEAIPWSFFIDYFTNIGELLDSCRLWVAPIGWVNRTIRNSTATTVRDFHFTVDTTYGQYIESEPKGFMLGRYVSRAPSSVPNLSFRFKCPGLTSLKWLNIAALSRQITQSRPVRAPRERPIQRVNSDSRYQHHGSEA